MAINISNQLECKKSGINFLTEAEEKFEELKKELQTEFSSISSMQLDDSRKKEVRIILNQDLSQTTQILPSLEKIQNIVEQIFPYAKYQLCIKIKSVPEKNGSYRELCENCDHFVYVLYGKELIVRYPSKHQSKRKENTIVFTDNQKKPREVVIIKNTGQEVPAFQKQVPDRENEAANQLLRKGFSPPLLFQHPVTDATGYTQRIRRIEEQCRQGHEIYQRIKKPNAIEDESDSMKILFGYFFSLMQAFSACEKERIVNSDGKFSNTLYAQKQGKICTYVIDLNGKLDLEKPATQMQSWPDLRSTWHMLPPEGIKYETILKTYPWYLALMAIQIIFRHSEKGIELSEEHNPFAGLLYEFVEGKRIKGPEREIVPVILPKTKQKITEADIQKVIQITQSEVEKEKDPMSKKISEFFFAIVQLSLKLDPKKRQNCEEIYTFSKNILKNTYFSVLKEKFSL